LWLWERKGKWEGKRSKVRDSRKVREMKGRHSKNKFLATAIRKVA